MAHSERILIVDDDPRLVSSLVETLSYNGYRARGVGDGMAAIKSISEDPPDAVLLDLKLPGKNGMDVLEEIKASMPKLPVIIISGHGDIAAAVEATRKGAYDFIEKPLEAERLRIAVRNAIEISRLEARRADLLESVKARYEILGASAAIKEVLNHIRMVAPTEQRVLITGESGTGKELVARNIHLESPRAEKVFKCVNCAAIPRELIESELFGHEKGAFTGATSAKPGQFEIANGATLFLDEVADLQPAAQASLLRAVEEGVIQRVGGTKDVQVDVRILAATNKDISSLVESGDFRQDLYYRLNGFHIHILPLRERPADIPVLAKSALARMAEQLNRDFTGIREDALAFLASLEWKGNVRELQNVIAKATFYCAGGELTPRHISRALQQDQVEPPQHADSTLKNAVEDFERFHILNHLIANDWQIQKTADALSIERTTLFKKMKKHRLGKIS